LNYIWTYVIVKKFKIPEAKKHRTAFEEEENKNRM
jgi:hypothetical protein